ncbi:MAG: glycosyltransferase family 2 protein [Gammaproteobacteria bacterium]|nr:glycosyltransferase family 2 protein [Gammaproteobacteria bacterium]
MLDKLLTIVIPTRNRYHLLSEYLESLIVECQKERVSLIVSDNNSNDGTGDLLDELRSKYQNLTVISHEKLLSIDESMIASACSVTSEYFYWLGDDDRLKDGALVYVKNVLVNKCPNLLLLNMEIFDEKHGVYKKMVKIDHDRSYDNALSFFCDNVFNLPFGSFVIHSDSYRTQFFKRYIGTSHAYSGLVFDYLSWAQKEEKLSLVVSSQAYVYSKRVEKSWVESKPLIMLYEIPKWFDLLDPYYSICSARIKRRYIRRVMGVRGLFQNFGSLKQIVGFDQFEYFPFLQKLIVKSLKKAILCVKYPY